MTFQSKLGTLRDLPFPLLFSSPKVKLQTYPKGSLHLREGY